MEKEYKAEIIYGDSVTGDTPILIRHPTGIVEIATIESLCEQWQKYERFVKSGRQKEQGFIHAQVWADGNWADIKRVIRHRTNKKIYRVNTFSGCVDVTEDHSLIGVKGDELRPQDLLVGHTDIKYSFPSQQISRNFTGDISETENEIWLWGLFYRYGSCNKNISISGCSSHILHKAKDYIEKIYQHDITVTLVSDATGNFQITVTGYKLVQKYRSLFYNNHNLKRVPLEILNTSEQNKRIFLKGFFTTRKTKTVIEKVKNGVHVYNKSAAQELYFLIKTTGTKDVLVTNTDVSYLLYSHDHFQGSQNTVTKIQQLESATDNMFVYDIETEDGVFQGGIGGIILKNTDSLFLTFPTEIEGLHGKDALQKTLNISLEASKKIKPL
ncbi:hypothetical protein EBU71_20805, partial [bacterium]|nr:hypothetical protein [Candidatus Elulimicrobium humile]